MSSTLKEIERLSKDDYNKGKVFRVIFYKWQGNIYHFSDNIPVDKKRIVDVRYSARARKYPDIVESAIADLQDRCDGRWDYDPQKLQWVNIPISASELGELPNGDRYIRINSIVYPITPFEYPRKKEIGFINGLKVLREKCK